MRWLMDFHHQSRGILARYSIEAPLPAAAVELGWQALVADYPPPPSRRRLRARARTERAGEQDGGGWLLHRIGKDPGAGSAEGAPAEAT
jgi:hypothetical protein